MSTTGPPGGPPDPRGRKRPAPTIDLKATEVASEPAKPASDPPAAEPPELPREATIHAQAEASHSPAEAPRAEAPPAQPPPDPPPLAPPPNEPPPSRPAIAWLPPDFPWPLAAAGAGGVVATLIALALAGVFTSRDGGTSPIETRLAPIEQQVRELAARPAPTSVDPRAIDDLAGRVSRLETVVATPRPPVADPALANRLALLEGEIRSLGERIGVVARRSDEVASIAGDARKRADATATALAELPKTQPPGVPSVPRAEIEALANRIAALERAAKAMEAQLAGRVGGDSADRSLRLVVVASTLNAAVERGVPFVAELGAAKAAAPDPKLLAALEPLASSGVPSTAALARELTALLPALAKTAGTASRGSGILDRLRASAEKVVSIRPIDEALGDDPAAILRRIELRAEQGNLAGAIAEIGKLPEPARALTKEWIARVDARNAVVEASRRFAASALAAIGKPSL